MITSDPQIAAKALSLGHLAALPTETVYGLGALIGQPGAIERIFSVKGRPHDHPLIVHVSPDAPLDLWASDTPDEILALTKAFWPGPLSVIVEKTDRVPFKVTGGQSSVGLRSPDNEGFQAVLAALSQLTGEPAAIAAPSANKFGEVSPTTASHVVRDIGDRLIETSDVVLDGGPSHVGIESTIVRWIGDTDLQPARLQVLRPGSITPSDLALVLGPNVRIDVVQLAASETRVSGSLDSHYSPRARVHAIEAGDELPSLDVPTGVIALSEIPLEGSNFTALCRPTSIQQFAAELYSGLRKADELGLVNVVVVLPQATGLGQAIRDRVKRSAS